MLVLDFINVGNGDAALIRQMDGGKQTFAMLVDCGHQRLERPCPESRRIYAGDFLRQAGVEHLDLLVLTHFHQDHIGGLDRVLRAASVGELVSTYLPPADRRCEVFEPLEADLPKAAQHLLLSVNLLSAALTQPQAAVARETVLTGEFPVRRQLTEELSLEIFFGEPALYRRQQEVYGEVMAGRQDRYAMLHWSKCMNLSSLRLRLHYRDEDIVLGGDAYAISWDQDALAPCRILKVPHHASLSSTTRKFLRALQPEIAVVSVAAGRKDERPHPAIVSLLQEYAREVLFTDAVCLPGLVKPQYHASVHLELA
jgi:beta-lactamase superfamily II metal-dependent hydrolase